MFKFLHAADIHLDSPLRGLERYEGAPREKMRLATRSALVNLVDLAIAEKVAFVLIAGDLYDGDWKDYNTGLFFTAQMARLREASIHVYLITGNHDAANRMTRNLRLPDNVKMLATDQPESILLDSLEVAIHGQGFARAAVTEDLSERYPAGKRGLFNIGMLHTCASGREGHESYAPCTLDGLRRKHYDYWALGHIHKRDFLSEDPPVVFPGNIQGRHIRETGAKGCMLVSVVDGRLEQTEFRPLDVLRWEFCGIDASTSEDADAVIEQVSDRLLELHRETSLPLAVRVEVTGTTPASDLLGSDPQRWLNELRSRAIELGAGDVWIEQVRWKTSPPFDESAPTDGPLGELLAILDELHGEDRLLEACKDFKELDDLARKLPAELKEREGFQVHDPAWLRGLLNNVQPLLARRLQAGGGPR